MTYLRPNLFAKHRPVRLPLPRSHSRRQAVHESWIMENGIRFGCASTPCTEFAKWGMRMFHANPPLPERGLKMFRHVERCFVEAGISYVMENVRSAQQFLGDAANHCGPFYLWGNAVPPIMPQGIIKGMTREAVGYREFKGSDKWNRRHALIASGSKSKKRKELVALNSAIPPELSACVANYAERILEIKYEPQKPNLSPELVREWESDREFAEGTEWSEEQRARRSKD